MSQILRYPLLGLNYFRADPNSHLLVFQKGERILSQAGASFWFRPMVTAISVIPVEDQLQTLHFTGRSADYQEVNVLGTVTFRVADPELAAKRIDFGIDLDTGKYLEKPVERMQEVVRQAAQQLAFDWMAHKNLDEVLSEAIQALRPLLLDGLRADPALQNSGIEVVTVRVIRVTPSPELEKALQAPTRESIQQTADEARFQRRAQAVEKERAISENELATKIELAKREEALIAERGSNERKKAELNAQALRTKVVGEAERSKLQTQAEVERARLKAQAETERAQLLAQAEAERIRLKTAAEAQGIQAIQEAKNEAEAERIAIYRDLPVPVLLGLSAHRLAGTLKRIDHLNLGPEGLGALLQNLLLAGTKKLEA
ncbi:MAG TPA: hypothetical protein ENK02_06420 [Planctomycetes bacterium]|nr:hypothetical protein [Planctomycetota bacterium]